MRTLLVKVLRLVLLVAPIVHADAVTVNNTDPGCDASEPSCAISGAILAFLLTVMITGCGPSHGVVKSTREPDIPTSIIFPSHGDFWYIKEGTPIEMESEAGYVEASIGQAFKQAFLFSFTNKIAIVVHNTKAFLKFGKGAPEFYTRVNPSEIGIVRFTVQPEENRRYVWVVSQVGSNAGYFYPETDDIPFSYAKMSNGIYRITLTEPLSSGEYGLVAPGGAAGYLAYSFSISDSH